MMGMMRMMPMMGMMGNAPGLNGQHADYIVDQLNRFSSGERQGMMMGSIAVMLNDTNKKAVSEYLSGLH
jgi:cytochrome c553